MFWGIGSVKNLFLETNETTVQKNYLSAEEDEIYAVYVTSGRANCCDRMLPEIFLKCSNIIKEMVHLLL